jgi:hypothetical protein
MREPRRHVRRYGRRRDRGAKQRERHHWNAAGLFDRSTSSTMCWLGNCGMVLSDRSKRTADVLAIDRIFGDGPT